MKQTVQVSRTAEGRQHLNRLRIPEFEAKSLYLKAGGGQVSNCHRPEGAPKQAEAQTGEDTFHFAPEKETLTIEYEINDPLALVDGAELQLFTRYKKDPLWTLDFKVLGEDWWAHGKHQVKWDGRIVKPEGKQAGTPKGEITEHDLTALAPTDNLVWLGKEPFPDGYVTLEHSPYKFRLVLQSKGYGGIGHPICVWTYFHILVANLELAYGPKEVLPKSAAGEADHRRVLERLQTQSAAPPAADATDPAKVFLESNTFKNNSNEMFDNTFFDRYASLWKEGPQIPLLVKVNIQDTGNGAVDAPKALGSVKFLWDWESKSTNSATGTHADGFVNNACDYDQAKTKPKGLNCHTDRGGKRGEENAAPVFPEQQGYDPQETLEDGKFPFKVETCDHRKWAATSQGWGSGKLQGRSGVIFQPSRMAGDSYRISVYLAWDKKEADHDTLKLDVEDDAPLDVPEPAKTMAASGTFQIWRKIHLRKYLKKRSAGVPALTLADIAKEYVGAYVDLEDVSGGGASISATDWNDAVTAAIAGWSDLEQLFIDSSVNQRAIGPEGMHFRTRAQFIQAWQKKQIQDDLVAAGVTGPNADAIATAGAAEANAAACRTRAKALAAGQGYGNADQDVAADIARDAYQFVATYMANPANNLNTTAKYANHLEYKAIAILEHIFNGHFDADDGVTIFQVEASHNLRHHQSGGYLLGLAHDFPRVNIAEPTRCGFLLMSKAADVACGNEKICAHEIGHHLFLPHPVDTAEKKDYQAHDQIVPSACLMSYNFNLAMDLCGLCHLRLRGWNKNVLDPDSSKNKQT